MDIKLAFRTSFFITALLGAVYTRTLITLTIVLALAAGLFYGHPVGNSVWQELLVFAWTWLAGVAVGWLLSPRSTPEWPVYYELSVIEGHLRARLTPRDGITWLCSAVLVIGSYAALELVGYDRGTFYRLQSFVWLLLLLLTAFVFDAVSRRGSTRWTLLPDARYHIRVVYAVCAALLVDICVRDVDMVRFLLPAAGVVALMAVGRALAQRRALQPHAKMN